MIRHAEGESFETHVQSPETILSAKGRKQAEAAVATKRFIDVDKIFCSTLKRAQETAQIIANGLSKEFETIGGIEERRQSSAYGLIRTDPRVIRYSQALVKKSDDWDWKWEKGEESKNEVLSRAIEFKKLLATNSLGRSILVVSHEYFVRMFIASCILGENSADPSFRRLYGSLNIVNTGISLLIYNEAQKTWKIWYLNDYSHGI